MTANNFGRIQSVKATRGWACVLPALCNHLRINEGNTQMTYTIETIRNYRTIKTHRYADYVEALDAFEMIERMDATFFLLSSVEHKDGRKITRTIATK